MNQENQCMVKNIKMNKDSSKNPLYLHTTPTTCSPFERFLSFIECVIPAIVAGLYFIVKALFLAIRLTIFTPFLWFGKLSTWIGEKGLGL
jgi:hypothetical protein